MIPKVIEFESVGTEEHIKNQAWALCNNFESVSIREFNYEPRLLGVIPEKEKAKPVLVFDPPPYVA